MKDSPCARESCRGILDDCFGSSCGVRDCSDLDRGGIGNLFPQALFAAAAGAEKPLAAKFDFCLERRKRMNPFMLFLPRAFPLWLEP